MVAFVGPLLAQAGNNGNGDDFDIASILGYIIVGAVVGVIARFLVPGRDPLGFLGTIVLGIVGAVIGGWAAGELFKDTSGVDWIGVDPGSHRVGPAVAGCRRSRPRTHLTSEGEDDGSPRCRRPAADRGRAACPEQPLERSRRRRSGTSPCRAAGQLFPGSVTNRVGLSFVASVPLGVADHGSRPSWIRLRALPASDFTRWRICS